MLCVNPLGHLLLLHWTILITPHLSLGGKFNSCLDSDFTDYIITSQALFQNYTAEGAVDIGTANCGSLSAKGLGDVTFEVPFEDHYVPFTCGCLHAPDVPMNLISVGALNESQLAVVFQPDSPTTISYPLTDPELPGFTFSTTVLFCPPSKYHVFMLLLLSLLQR